jgi:hypothetical protein
VFKGTICQESIHSQQRKEKEERRVKDEDVLKVQVKGSREGGGGWLISGGREMLRLAAGSKENSQHELSSSQNVAKCVKYCYGPHRQESV